MVQLKVTVQAGLGKDRGVMTVWSGVIVQSALDPTLSNNNQNREGFASSGEHAQPPEPQYHSVLGFHHVVGEHQDLVVHGGVVTLICQQWGWVGGTIPISLFNWPWLVAGPPDTARFIYFSIF